MTSEEIQIKHLALLAEEALQELSDNGREYPVHHEGRNQLLDKWNSLWVILCNLKGELSEIAEFKSKLKEYVIEEVAREILVPHGINLKQITDKYECEE